MLRLTILCALLFFVITPVVFSQDETTTNSGIVAGSVKGADGQPIEGASIRLIQVDSRNRIVAGFTAPVASSDSNGEYIFKNVPEGDYAILAQYWAPSGKSDRLNSYYFPGVLELRDARIVRVGPDSILTAMQINCASGAQGFQATGRVIDSDTQKSVAGIRLIYGLRPGSGGNGDFSARTRVQTDADGSFILTDLKAGKHWAGIYHNDSADYYCTPIYFEIIDSDLSNLVIPVRRGVSLSGRVFLDDGIPESLLGRTTVDFYPSGISAVDRGPVYNLIDSYLTISSLVSPDGTFLLKGIPPLSGRLYLKYPGATTTANYVTVIEHNDKNISQAVSVKDSNIENIQILVTSGKGAIRVRVRCDNGILDFDRLEVSVSLQNDEVAFFGKKLKADPEGIFATDNLLPGKYLVMVVRTHRDGRLKSRTGPVRYVTVRNGELSEIEITVPGEQAYEY